LRAGAPRTAASRIATLTSASAREARGGLRRYAAISSSVVAIHGVIAAPPSAELRA
jgi:hypothetical protein